MKRSLNSCLQLHAPLKAFWQGAAIGQGLIVLVLCGFGQWALLPYWLYGTVCGALFWWGVQWRTQVAAHSYLAELIAQQRLVQVAWALLSGLSVVGVAWLLARPTPYGFLGHLVVMTGFFGYKVGIVFLFLRLCRCQETSG